MARSDRVAAERGRLDVGIAGPLFMAELRRSEVSALRWADCPPRGQTHGLPPEFLERGTAASAIAGGRFPNPAPSATRHPGRGGAAETVESGQVTPDFEVIITRQP